ncbi:MAG: substrate-binding domain-containing protein [Acidobacteria bacterium]|nr:substrate-binding domain-containing protein [Acidobacteriota bacterium]
MIKLIFNIGLTLLLLWGCPLFCAADKAVSKPVRAAVIGGMTMTPLWGEIQEKFEVETGIPIEVVVTGEKPALARAMKEGRVDFLTMHSSDTTTNLVADGWARDLRPWAKNDLVIVGPVDDPAGISGLRDGAEAVKRIAETNSNWLDFLSNGPRETAHTLFSRAGVRMIGPWVLKYEHTGTKSILHYVAGKNAYMIVGRMPVLFRKMDPDPDVKIMVQGDPNMRRPYMAMVANPERFPSANFEGAARLSDFLLSDKIQNFLASYDGGIGDGIPIFIPVRSSR